METTRTDLRQTARLFQALSDETRLLVVLMLARGEHCVCDLQEAVGAYQSRLSFHLRKLKDAGLVVDRREGRWVYYALQPEALETMRAFLSDVEPSDAAWSSPTGRCCT